MSRAILNATTVFFLKIFTSKKNIYKILAYLLRILYPLLKLKPFFLHFFDFLLPDCLPKIGKNTSKIPVTPKYEVMKTLKSP